MIVLSDHFVPCANESQKPQKVLCYCFLGEETLGYFSLGLCAQEEYYGYGGNRDKMICDQYTQACPWPDFKKDLYKEVLSLQQWFLTFCNHKPNYSLADPNLNYYI